MKKQITTIALGILMLAGVMAMSNCDIKYSGDSCSFQTDLTNPVYTIVGNSTIIGDELEVKFEGGNITISTDPLMASDNFTLVFFDEVTKEVIKYINTGGGGSSGTRTEYVDKNVTVYVPEYVDKIITEEVEVEKIIDKIEYVERGFALWHILLGILVGIGFGWIVLGHKKKEVEEVPEF